MIVQLCHRFILNICNWILYLLKHTFASSVSLDPLRSSNCLSQNYPSQGLAGGMCDDGGDPPDAVVDFIGRYSGASDSVDSIDVEGFCGDSHIKQWASRVIDYSSQYGSHYSISYTATNIIGKPTIFPVYGDYPETFAMRTYGTWWGEQAPSFAPEIQPQNLPKVSTQDYIVLQFDDYVIPEEVTIYETFNPGAVVRIWAYTIARKWFCLWENEKFHYEKRLPREEVRCMCPPLRKLQLPTKILRLEFNHTYLHYFTEIDGVELTGRSLNMKYDHNLVNYYEKQRKDTIVRKLKSIKFCPNFEENQTKFQDFLDHDLQVFVAAISETTINELGSSDRVDGKINNKRKRLTDLPFEVMLHIFGYLDLPSVFRAGRVCRFFFDVSIHPSLYSEINLKPFWHLASTDLLCTLAKRAIILKKLDLSWCGLHNSISSTEFKKLIQQRGDTLTHLRLNSCSFLRAACIQTVGIVCDNLKELSLRNYPNDSPVLFSSLANLKNLERLDLFQTVTEPDLLLTMLEANRKLKHLNLAFCDVAVNMDEVAQHIGQFNLKLISLDMWKSHFLTATGIRALSNCHDLEEVDFGWCLREATLSDSLKDFLTNCPKLKKLFLATVRSVTDLDVGYIAQLCSNLEQLDLMGVLGISKERYEEVLDKCKKLKMMDISFCDRVKPDEIDTWMRNYNVDIKCIRNNSNIQLRRDVS